VPSQSLTSEQVLALLAATPPRIAALAAELTPAQLQAAPPDGGWSVNEVLAHLRACADVWGNCIVEIVVHDRPRLRAVNPTTWIKRTDYRDQDFEPSLHAFATQRTDLLAVLEPLAPDGWSRTVTVTGAGKPLERTALLYARWLAVHERPHLQQIQRIVNTLSM
jgi:hypothetical protein